MRADPDRTFLPAPPLPPGRPRLVVTGFMGTGKTESGRAAARQLGLPFVDLDQVVERRAGGNIGEIFDAGGEDGFRAVERVAVRDAARLSAVVVATGGGAVLDTASFSALAEGASVVVLTCQPEEVARRLGPADGRPLLHPDPAERIGSLLAERATAYAAAGQALDTTRSTPEAAGRALAARYPGEAGGIPRLAVQGPDGPYPVLIGTGVLDRLGTEVGSLIPPGGRAAVVVDGAVDATVGDRVTGALRDAGIGTGPRIVLPPGEAAKTAETLGRIWTELRAAELDPSGAVVAVGGGAALDVAGFAAATFGRGVTLVNVPTTLLAMVDAAVGGKVAVDHAGVKNLVGTFHHPRAIVADTATLASLPAEAVRGGLAECAKAFVLASPLGLDVLEAMPVDERGLPADLPWVIEQAVRIKAAYVAEDPGDRGLRHSLNLGHTFAHALESASGNALPHGEAVSAGLVAAARLGTALGRTDPALPDRLGRLMGRLGLPAAAPEGVDAAAGLHAAAADKKRRGGRSAFVVPVAGGAEIVRGLDPAVAFEALGRTTLAGR